MKLFWCTQTNQLVSASPCEHCGGFEWRYIGPETRGLWLHGGCYPAEPDGETFLTVPRPGVGKEQPSPAPEGDLK